MTEARPAPNPTLSQVETIVEDWLRANEHSNIVRNRWFASYLRSNVLASLRRMRVNNLSDQDEADIKLFREIEIQYEKSKLLDQIKRLEDEEKKLAVAS